MAVATENVFQTWSEDRVRDMQVDSQANVADLFKGTMVNVVTATGFIRPASDTAAEVFSGVALEEINQAVGDAAGANSIRIAQRGVFQFNAAGLTQADVMKRVNVSDDNTVTLTGANTVRVGTIVEVISATVCLVAIDVQVP